MNSLTDCGDQLSSNDDFQLGSYLRFHNSIAGSTMSLSDTSICDISSVATPVDQICDQKQCELSPPLEMISFKKSGVVAMDHMDMVTTTKKLEEPLQMEIRKKKKEKKKKKDAKKEGRSQSKRRMQRRSSWTASHYNHDAEEETHNHVPIEVFSTSLDVDTPSEQYREFQSDHLTFRQNQRKSRSIGYFSSYLDNNNDDDDDGVIRCFKSSYSNESSLMFEEQSSKSEYQVETFHSNELMQSSVVANHETYPDVQAESQKWYKSDIKFLSERNTSYTQITIDDEVGKGDDKPIVPEEQKKMKRRNSWHSSIQNPQETSSSRVNNTIMNSSHRSLTYVIDLKARDKVWVAKDSQELDNLPTFQEKKEGKSWFGKSRSGHIETSPDIVIVSSANMPQDTEAASINSLEHGLTCVQLTAFGDVTTITYEP